MLTKSCAPGHASYVLLTLAAGLLLGLLPADRTRAADDPKFEAHEWSLWVVDPTLKLANAKDSYPSALPATAGALRANNAASVRGQLAPISVLSFYGQPVPALDVSLRTVGGRFLGHWPRAQEKSQRLRWLDLAAAPAGDAPSRAYVSSNHWLDRARKLGSLELRQGARSESVLVYDAEFNLPVPLVLSGGPDNYQARNAGSAPLYDLLVCLPTSGGVRIGWLDVVPPVKQGSDTAKKDPATAEANTGSEVRMSKPLALGSKEFERQASGEIRRRLLDAGLKAGEVDLPLSLIDGPVFKSPEMVAMVRLSPGTVEEHVPLEIIPEPAKTVRVALVLLRHIDPAMKQETESLVKQLGDPSYAKREAATKRLAEMGSLAKLDLEKALKATDLETVSRAERLLEALKSGPATKSP